MATPERLVPCPPPDMMQGRDQCEHGTWPCAETEAAWAARGIDRDEEMREVQRQLVSDAVLDDVKREQQQETEAADRAGRLPWWEAEALAEELEAGQ